MTLTDTQVLYFVGIVGPLLGFITAWAATHQRREESLNDTVDSRIRIILQERQDRITELQSELHKLRIVVENFRDIMQAVLMASNQCPNALDGACPLVHVELSKKLSHVMNDVHSQGGADVSVSK